MQSLPHTKKNYNYISIRTWKSSFNNNNNYNNNNNNNTTCPEVTWIKYSNTQQYSFTKERTNSPILSQLIQLYLIIDRLNWWKKIVDFKDFFTNLLLTSWHLACTWETWSSSLCNANSLPSILYLNITKRWKVSEKLKGPSVPDLVPKQAVISLQFSQFLPRHVTPCSAMLECTSFTQPSSLTRKRARFVNINARKRGKLQILRGNT